MPTVTLAGVRLVFGLDWHPVERPRDLAPELRRARLAGYRAGVVLADRSLVGLAKALQPGIGKPHSLVALLVERLAGEGAEAYLIGIGKQVAFAGLMDRRPVPGFDRLLPDLPAAAALLQEFRDIHRGQEVRIATTLRNAVDGAAPLALDALLELPGGHSQVRGLSPVQWPRRVWMAIAGGLAFLLLGAWGGWAWYAAHQRDELARQAALASDPQRLYEQALPALLKQAGAPGNALLAQWRALLGALPVTREGWSLQRFDCRQTRPHCIATWIRRYGNFNDFERGGLIGQAGGRTPAEGVKDDVLGASLTTQHPLPVPPDSAASLSRERLPSLHEATRRWGSRLQDLMLAAEKQGNPVTLNPARLLGEGAMASLKQPVVTMGWRIADDIWSLPTLDLPDYAVPEALTVQLDASRVNYVLTGAIYAQGKNP